MDLELQQILCSSAERAIVVNIFDKGVIGFDEPSDPCHLSDIDLRHHSQDYELTIITSIKHKHFLKDQTH